MGKAGGIITCIIGGALMLLASIVGTAASYLIIGDIVAKQLPEYRDLIITFLGICVFIAGFGGASVIVGAIIAFKVRPMGKWIIGLGAGMGLIGFISWIVTGIIAGTLTGTVIEILIGLLLGPASYGIIGVFITIFGRKKIKKKKEDEAE
ncbi:MAG: hypothetical protein ACTSPS_05825 [Promethearchaeota archaeon]